MSVTVMYLKFPKANIGVIFTMGRSKHPPMSLYSRERMSWSILTGSPEARSATLISALSMGSPAVFLTTPLMPMCVWKTPHNHFTCVTTCYWFTYLCPSQITAAATLISIVINYIAEKGCSRQVAKNQKDWKGADKVLTTNAWQRGQTRCEN